jgi:Ca2+:H+ antiporter
LSHRAAVAQQWSTLSIFVAVIMIGAYCANLSLRSIRTPSLQDVEKYEPKWSVKKSVGILFVATIVVAWMSEILVGSIEPLVVQLGLDRALYRRDLDRDHRQCGGACLGYYGCDEKPHGLGTPDLNRLCVQIAMFAAPVLVLASLFFPTHMGLVFNTFELVAIIFSVFIVNSISEDGESNWFEGVQLFAAYAIMAVAFFFHP